MKKWLFSIVTLALAVSLYALEDADRSLIQGMIQRFTDTWNHEEGKGMADLYATDAEFVNIFGSKFSGKTEIEVRHQHILKTFLKHSKFEILNTELREIQPGVVIASVSWRLDGFHTSAMDPASAGETRDGIFTHVFVRSDKKWEIAISHNTMMPKR